MRNADLIAIVAVSTAVVALVLAAPVGQPARVALGLPFVLLFPGYALLAALFPRGGDIDPLGRLGLSAGLSVAVVALIGLALNYSSWGVRLHPLLAAITLLIGLACLAAAVHRQLVDPAPAIEMRMPSARRLVAGVAALAVAATTVAGAYLALDTGGEPEGFTEFYALDADGGLESYPRLLAEGERAQLVLGVSNHEGEEARYRIATRIGGRYTGSVRSVALGDGESWEGLVGLTLPGEGRQRVELLLYQQGEDSPYRTLRLWLTMEPSGPAFVEAPRPPEPTPEPAALSVVSPPAEATPEPAPQPEPPLTAHTVSPGEYLTLIAAIYGVPLDSLIAANDIPDPDLIYPDQTINLGTGAE
ncbi:MAG: DUF1616 domain-containing protein [Dehalococcoidia bacterium]